MRTLRPARRFVTVTSVARRSARRRSATRPLQRRALAPVAARAQDLQVLDRARAAEAVRDDVVVLQVEAEPHSTQRPPSRSKTARRTSAGIRSRRGAASAPSRASVACARCERAPRAPLALADERQHVVARRGRRPRRRSAPRTATCSAARRARARPAARAAPAAIARTRRVDHGGPSRRRPALKPPAPAEQRQPRRATSAPSLDLAQHARLAIRRRPDARARRALRARAAHVAGAIAPARATSRAIRRASMNASASSRAGRSRSAAAPRWMIATRQ